VVDWPSLCHLQKTSLSVEESLPRPPTGDQSTVSAKKQPPARAKPLTVRWNGWGSILSQIVDEGEYYLVPADQLPAMVDRMAKASANMGRHKGWFREQPISIQEIYRARAIVSLRSIGIRVPRRALQRGEGK